MFVLIIHWESRANFVTSELPILTVIGFLDFGEFLEEEGILGSFSKDVLL